LQRLIVNYESREKRYALLSGKTVDKLMIDQPDQISLVGNIYLGIVTKVLPGLNAAFIDIGEEKSGFLPRNKVAAFIHSADPKKELKGISSFLHQGEKLLVQVEKDATGTKGPRVSGILEFSGTNVVYMPEGRYIAVSKKIDDEAERELLRKLGASAKDEHEGIIFRTSAAMMTESSLLSEIEALRKESRELSEKASGLKKTELLLRKDLFWETLLDEIRKMDTGEVVIDNLALKLRLEAQGSKENKEELHFAFYNGKENVFSFYKIEQEIDKALKRIVWLENGAYLIFDEAEALTIIDVNTGKFSGNSSLRETVKETNMMAAREIARQLSLRDLGGIILIDFIDMKFEEDRQAILERVKSAMAGSGRQTKVIGFTPLGILQLTRKKTKVSLSEALTERCQTCEGTGRILSAETIAFRLERELWEHRNSEYEAVLIETTEEVKKMFTGGHSSHQAVLEEAAGFKIFFVIRPSCHHFYSIKQFGDLDAIEQKTKELY